MAENQGVIGALETHDLDALVMPTFASFYLPAVAGLPIITVPMGFLPNNTPLLMNSKGTMVNAAPGIPFGLAFVGRRWSEETLIAFAYAFEQRTMVRKRRKPYIQAAFEIGDQTLGAEDADRGRDNIRTGDRPVDCGRLQAAVLHEVGRRPSPARRGASLAFLQATTSSKSHSDTHSGSNGALAAASVVSLGERRDALEVRDGVLAVHQNSSRISRPHLYSQRSRNSMSENCSDLRARSREQSPFSMVAQLAASRATLPTRDVLSDPKANAPHASSRYNSPGQSPDNDAFPSKTSTPATRSIVQLYESGQSTKPLNRTTHSIRYTGRAPPTIVNPRPIRPLARANSSASVLSATLQDGLSNVQQQPAVKKPDPSHIGTVAAAVAELAGPTLEATAESKGRVPELPPPRRSRPVSIGSVDTNARISSVDTSMGRTRISEPDMTEMSLPSKEARSIVPSPPVRKSDAELSTRLPQASRNRPVIQASRSLNESRQIHQPTRPSQDVTRLSDSYIPQLSVNSLANAMVASSLASSRAASPTKPIPPPPRRHGKPHLFRSNHSQELISRTPSPAKGMRQTMREPRRSDDEVEHKKKSHLVRKHPNKHHEGDRKRYRTQVTERERKRYEGVWAANKGLLMPEASENAVLNIVVRDIWRRSRLPDDVLAQVWDLVSLQDLNRLGREEFVVGMWLIDQRLKGHKLPIKVSESVWSSVKRLNGIKVPRNK
ncbi:MAG: hypothetical protein Q9217_002488 [Psora testacea]